MFTPTQIHTLPRLALLIILCAGLLAGCNKPRKAGGIDKTKQPGKNPLLTAGPGQPTAKMPPKMSKQPLFAGADILIGFKGAARARATRSKDEALKLAKELAAKARKAPGTFSALAKKHSEGPSARMGGFLRIWPKGRMPPTFDAAIAKLKFDEISEPVETPFGYHVIKRLAIFAGAHILVAYKGAQGADAKITRSKEEARKKTKDLMMKARKDPTIFGKLAKENSDGPSKTKGGDLGVWWKGRMVPAFDATIEKLKVGQISEVVETPFGFHVMVRKKAPTKSP